MRDNDIVLTGRAWIKEPAVIINGRSIYTFSIQSIYTVMQNYLREHQDFGAVILDSRWHGVNRQVAHSIFTQKFRSSGDAFDRIIDLPSFAHSDNHAGLQIADLLASAIIFPMAVHTYCAGRITNLHVKPNFVRIKDRYKNDMRSLQYRYQEANGRQKGGIIVSDALGKQPGGLIFR